MQREEVMNHGQNVQVALNSIRYLLSFIANVLFMILVIYGVFQICGASYHFCYEIFGPVVMEDAPGRDHYFHVAEGETMFQVAERLEEEQLIASKYSFYIRTELMDQKEVRLRPGNYVLNTSMDYEEIINDLTTSEG